MHSHYCKYCGKTWTCEDPYCNESDETICINCLDEDRREIEEDFDVTEF